MHVYVMCACVRVGGNDTEHYQHDDKDMKDDERTTYDEKQSRILSNIKSNSTNN